jgi:Ulp1 family protease
MQRGLLILDFFDIDTIVLPVGLDNNYWALGVIRPSRLELLLYDSAQPWRTDEREKHL